jgi:hypothetical protein
MRTRKPKGPKKVPYRLIDPELTDAGKTMYALLKRLVRTHHDDLEPAKIALAWHAGWKADVDGRRKLGMLKKCSDLDREFRPFDFVVILNRPWWESPGVTDAQREALLDHELCHGARKADTNGEPMEDERGRPVFRLVKHDIEEFAAVVRRHGCYKKDLEHFSTALRESQPNLFAEPEKPAAAAPTNGNGNGKGGTRVIPAAEFTKALKKEARDKGWVCTRRTDGSVEIRVPAVS